MCILIPCRQCPAWGPHCRCPQSPSPAVAGPAQASPSEGQVQRANSREAVWPPPQTRAGGTRQEAAHQQLPAAAPAVVSELQQWVLAALPSMQQEARSPPPESRLQHPHGSVPALQPSAAQRQGRCLAAPRPHAIRWQPPSTHPPRMHRAVAAAARCPPGQTAGPCARASAWAWQQGGQWPLTRAAPTSTAPLRPRLPAATGQCPGETGLGRGAGRVSGRGGGRGRRRAELGARRGAPRSPPYSVRPMRQAAARLPHSMRRRAPPWHPSPPGMSPGGRLQQRSTPPPGRPARRHAPRHPRGRRRRKRSGLRG